jgi:hypothetical protein
MSSFAFPSLLWFLPLIGVPVLIHLINLLRHRRVKWAAMEFLLQSQKRNRTWVMLKQLLLLLLRMIAVAGVVSLAAQPQARNTLGALLGGTKTHHIVLLDDSFSMSDHWADTTAFKQAKEVVGRLGRQLSRQGGQQEFTLLTFSQAAHRGQGLKATLSREPISSQFADLLDEKLLAISCSEMANGPSEGLGAIGQLIRSAGDSTTIVYLVSDFRAREWNNAAEIRKALLDLNESGAQLQLIDCVDAERPNLAIAALKPELGIRAAGVPLKMQIAVTNYGPQTAHEVSVQLAEDRQARPAVTIPSIPPGQTVAADFEVRYQNLGQHSITATLPADAVGADNARYTVLDFPQAVPILVIDGDAKAKTRKGDAYFVSLPFSATTVTPTGVKPQIESPSYLRTRPLDGFHVIYLLDIERLEQPEIDALEAYVRGGGGLVFFVGEHTRADFVNSRLYRDGKGVFPAPLVGPTELLVDRAETASDLLAEANHPVFSLLARQPSVDIDRAIIEKYFAVEKHWTPPPTSETKVVVHLRNGAPLVIESKFGDGRVMAFLTTAAPTWNNLARTPLHIGAMLQLAAYMSAARQTDPSRQVGAPLETEFDRNKYLPLVKFYTPIEGAAGIFPVEAAPPKVATPSGTATKGAVSKEAAAKDSTAKSPDSAQPNANAPAPVGQLAADLPVDTVLSGFYAVELTAPDGHTDTRRFAYNVQSEEGNLKIVDGPQLESRLGGVKYHFHRAADAFFGSDDVERADLSRFVLYLLLALLIGEQMLAYSASYHPKSREVAR